MKIRCYKELKRLPTFKERYEYLKVTGEVGQSTFGSHRSLNQVFYHSQEWRDVRREVILRDNGCDLGMEGYEIGDRIYIHHMNPIMIEQIEERDPDIFNPDYLICVSFDTHNAIHYGDDALLPKLLIERKPNDTCLWRGGR